MDPAKPTKTEIDKCETKEDVEQLKIRHKISEKIEIQKFDDDKYSELMLNSNGLPINGSTEKQMMKRAYLQQVDMSTNQMKYL